MTRADVVEKVLAAKLAKKLTWKALAEACGRSDVWATSALLGQQAMSAEEAVAVGRLLDLGAEEITLLQVPPAKGSLGRRSRPIRLSIASTRWCRSTARPSRS